MRRCRSDCARAQRGSRQAAAPFERRRPRHSAEGVRERARVGIAQSGGDFGDADARALEQLHGDLEAHLVQQFAKRRALRLQAPIERARMHREPARRRRQGDFAEQDAGAQGPNDLVGDIGQSERPIVPAERVQAA
jgi:hypothetical protein